MYIKEVDIECYLKLDMISMERCLLYIEEAKRDKEI